MDQKIFDMGLSVEGISVYLALCGLADEGRELALGDLEQVWNGTPDALESALKELKNRGVLRGNDENDIDIMDSLAWKR